MKVMGVARYESRPRAVPVAVMTGGEGGPAMGMTRIASVPVGSRTATRPPGGGSKGAVIAAAALVTTWLPTGSCGTPQAASTLRA